MSRINHIVFISPGFPKDDSDSVCIPPLQSYLTAFKKANPSVKVSVAALHYPDNPKSYCWKGIDVTALNGERYRGIKKPLLWRKLNLLLERWHLLHPIDIIHSIWLTDSTFFAQHFCQKYSIAHFATVMGRDAFPSNKYLKWINFSKIRVIGLSKHSANVFFKSTGERVGAIIPWGIDPEITQYNNLSPTAERDIDIISVSSFTRIKRHDLALEIIHEIKKNYSSIKSILVGKGTNIEDVKSFIESNDLRYSVMLTGELQRPYALKLIGLSKMLLHTSDYEGQGYVILEALALGTPVVVFDIGFLPHHELVHICNSKGEMVRTVDRILSEPVHRQGAVPVTIQDTVDAYWTQYN